MATGDNGNTSCCRAVDAFLHTASDLTGTDEVDVRYQRLIFALSSVLPCDAAVLFRYDDGMLIPVATQGMTADVLGRRYHPDHHPRLKAILSSHAPVRFEFDDPLQDPFIGLMSGDVGGARRAHACMGSALRVGDQLVGALTIDALDDGAYDRVDDREFSVFAALAAANLQMVDLIASLENSADRRGMVLQHLVEDAHRRGGGDLIGKSEKMARLREEIRVVAASDLAVLITGETGTGKEVVARTLHAQSARAKEPLVYVNCAALPEALAESELFGHMKGAFTSADAHRIGKFELADRSTLFLDEIGELPPAIQPKLLRALQSGEIQRVGSDKNLHVDVRIIAATNRRLEAEVKAGRFRADLFHRISVYPIHAPPLRDHPEDIVLMAGHLLEQARIRMGLGPVRLTDAALEALTTYAWPGNVRELDHVITRGALRASRGGRSETALLDEAHLGFESQPSSPRQTADDERPHHQTVSLRAAMTDFKRRVISDAVANAHGNWALAARRLKLHRSNLYRAARKLGLKSPDMGSESNQNHRPQDENDESQPFLIGSRQGNGSFLPEHPTK